VLGGLESRILKNGRFPPKQHIIGHHFDK